MQRALTVVIVLLALSAPVASAIPSAPTDPSDPIFNGELEEPFVPEVVPNPLSGTPVDRCIGIGHQALYGDESPQGQATGGDYSSPNASQADPVGAANATAQDPNATADQQTACSYGQDDGYDLVWLSPVDKTEAPEHWSFDPRDPGVEFGYTFDGDPLDREAKFVPGQGSRHNMWQAYPSPFQAYSANFDHLTLTVENGTIPDNALIQVSLSATPMNNQTPEVPLWRDCALNFRGSELKANQDANGVVEMSPLDAGFSHTGDEECQDLHATWHNSTTSDAERRQILGRLRIVQVSFWAWNTGTEAVVVDSIHAPGATTVAEEAADGNVRVDPDDDFE